MIVLIRKNNIIFISLAFILSIFLFMLSLSGESPHIAAVSLANKIIIIDPGHGGEDGGATGRLTGVLEKDISLSIAKKLKVLVEQTGDLPIMTREEDISIYDVGKKTLREKKISDLRNRKSIIDKSGANLFVSIHLNIFPEGKYYGAQAFFPKGSDASKKLASVVQQELKGISERPNERVPMPRDDVIIMKNPAIPGVIVECGFLSNEEDERLLKDDAYQQKLAEAIYRGISKYLESQQPPAQNVQQQN